MGKTSLSSLEPFALSLLRIVAGFMLMPHGAQKLLGVLGGMGGEGATARFATRPWFAGVLELFGGLLLMLGLFTQPTAFILSGLMAFAYFLGHSHLAFWPIANRGELAALYCFVFLYLSAAGGGPISLDRVIRKRK